MPSGAHRRTAGAVVTDLLILRRRAPGEPPGSDEWVRTEQVPLGTGRVDTGDGGTEIARVNSYFLQHPDRVLGRMSLGHGMYGASTLIVRADDLTETGTRLAGALDDLVNRARTAGTVFTMPLVEPRPRAAALVPDIRHWAGHITAHPGGGSPSWASTAERTTSWFRAHSAANSERCSGCGTSPGTSWRERPPAGTTPHTWTTCGPAGRLLPGICRSVRADQPRVGRAIGGVIPISSGPKPKLGSRGRSLTLCGYEGLPELRIRDRRGQLLAETPPAHLAAPSILRLHHFTLARSGR